jgi:nucleoside-specific outer membrane channel protein Tsx
MICPARAFVRLAVVGLAVASSAAYAATWSDTFIGYRYGTQFHEPNNANDVTKNILQLTHSSGYSIGQNFVNLDLLQSNSKDPSSGSGSTGATEAYLTFRTQLHLSKVFDRPMAFGPVKEVALTAGFDLNTKNTRFAPRKRLLVVGPTLKFDVPGFLDVSLFYGQEWNHCGLGAPGCPREDIKFDPQWMVSASWRIPFDAGPLPLRFQGFINYMSEKGNDYANVATDPETLMRTALMVDVGQMASWKKDTVLVGVGYELWRNKFGNHSTAAGATKPGIDTDALMFQAEWHF